LTHRLRLNC